MEKTSVTYQPDGDSPHEITAEVAEEEGEAFIFRIQSDGEEIGEVDVELLSPEAGFISGVGPGEKINNGYLRPASLAIATCLKGEFPQLRNLFDFNNELISSDS